MQLSADPAKGEAATQTGRDPAGFALGGKGRGIIRPGCRPKPVVVEMKAYRDNSTGHAATCRARRLDRVARIAGLPSRGGGGSRASFMFTVTAPRQTGTAELTARATIDGKTYDTGRQEIRYEHIPPQLLQPPARVKALCLDLKIRGRRVGYLPGAGDRTMPKPWKRWATK